MIRPYCQRILFAVAVVSATNLNGCGKNGRDSDRASTPLAQPVLQPERVLNEDPIAATESTELTQLPPEAWQLRDVAAAALESGDVAAAGKAIRAAVRTSPNDPENTFLMAIVLGEERRYHEAVRLLDRLAKDSTEARLPALGQTAEWLVQQGDWTQAEKRFRLVLDEVPDAVMALRQLSQLLIRQGRRLDAVECLHELCRLGNVEEVELSALLSLVVPFSSDAVTEQLEPVNTLGRARLMISSGDMKGAAELLAVESSANADEAKAETALLGRIYAEQKENEKLRDWAANHSASQPSHSDAWFAIGIDHANQGNQNQAIEFLCEAILRDPTDPKAYQALSESLRATNATRESEQASERAQWLTRTQEIGKLMAQSSERDPKLVMELAQLLDQLHRPFESLAWQAVLLAYSQSVLSESQQQSRMAEINQRRLKLIEANEETASDEFLLCGIDIDKTRASLQDDAPAQSTD